VWDGDGGDPAKDGGVGQLVLELVHGHGHVARLLRTRVQVPDAQLLLYSVLQPFFPTNVQPYSQRFGIVRSAKKCRHCILS
jgi:hypothetical protein